MYIKNPFGRIVEVSDEKPIDESTGKPSTKLLSDYENWLLQPGFTVPSQAEIDTSIAARKKQIEDLQREAELTKELYGKTGVYFVTVTQGGKDGYGIVSKNLFRELRDLDVNISFNNIGQKIALLLHAPYSITRLESPIRLLYTMFESTKIPKDWIDYLEQADTVIVPSKWCQEVFAKEGIETMVIPLGYDENTYKLIDRPERDLTKEDFTFLHYNAFNIRKGFTEVFKAFVDEFQPDEPVKMVFKTTLKQMPIPIRPDQYPNIEVITGEYTEHDMQELLARSDAFVFPSRGEGFGMTPLEAMATGLPTIIPNAHGLTEYFNADYMYEVKIKEECPALYSRYKNQDVGHMFISDVEDLRRQMRYIYEHKAEAKAKGIASSEYVKNWTFKKTAVQLKELIDKMEDKKTIEKPLKNVLRLETISG